MPGEAMERADDRVEALYQEVRESARKGTGLTRRPASTYRLQLHASFGFEAAARAVPYLHALGITDVYLSPILKAAPGVHPRLRRGGPRPARPAARG